MRYDSEESRSGHNCDQLDGMARGGVAADARSSGDDDASEPETEDYSSPGRSRAALLGRERKRPSSVRLCSERQREGRAPSD